MQQPEAKAYVAVAIGAKQYNMAKVYAGHYGNKGGER
jgi:chitin synthase